MTFKKIFICFAILITYIHSLDISVVAKTKEAQVLIINQVRGEECCSKGSLTNLEFQLKNAVKLKTPSYFNLRYDVLTNGKYTELIKNYKNKYSELINTGIFLEITPDLAKKSEVQYNGTNDRWYEAQNAYTIGYNYIDRKKIVDTVFKQYFEEFGEYPEITTAWMIDTLTLNYINEAYGVKMHQITREQWGTDSYTLYGGPPHYPYKPSKNWLFIPDSTSSRNLIIVRQTVTDPIYNYGDKTNAFTSQPNDYTLDGKNIEYFKKIVNQALFEQNSTGFVLLGLENSMAQKHQKEYFEQLKYISELREQNKIFFPSSQELIKSWGQKKVTSYEGKDHINLSDSKAYWITSDNYRVRLIEINNKLFLTDLRLYDKNYLDPYTNSVGKKEGYWIVPFLIDGSINIKKFRAEIKFDRKNDTEMTSEYLEIGQIADSKDILVNNSFNKIKFQFTDNKKNNKEIEFLEDKIKFNSFNVDDFNMPIQNDKLPVKNLKTDTSVDVFWQEKDGNLVEMKINCLENNCDAIFYSKEELLNNARSNHKPLLFPESNTYSVDPFKTSIRLNNKFAQAGRNPVRFIITPIDSFGEITTMNTNYININQTQDLKIVHNTYNELHFLDLYADIPTESDIEIKIKNQIVYKNKVFFSPNCKVSLKYCLKNPEELSWYIQSFIGDKYRQIDEYIQKNIYETEN